MSTKRRQRQLAAMRARRAKRKSHATNGRSLDDPLVRDRIAEAVHQAVCEFTATDGFGHCILYSVAGMALLGCVFDHTTYIQAGTLGVLLDPADDYWMVMDAAGIRGGE